MDNSDIPFDRIRAINASKKLIQDFIDGKITIKKTKLDPVSIHEILNLNISHLQYEAKKGELDKDIISSIENYVSLGNQYIIDNPDNGDGGGNNQSIVYFQDCMKGYSLGVDFSPNPPPRIKIGQVLNISSDGYKGCVQTIDTPKEKVPVYAKPYIGGYYESCEQCIKEM